ncbi:hypothetical protein TCON_1085 [Astathelohania contejeani]|uniref:Uncharacterized protein n=1 Tax=Astathelohania contejeani TaxID=164912 RepID=A0ABQ7HZY2_9MICR|nr:hypothetical protein TCON_1085 [Thelohania contejeani]
MNLENIKLTSRISNAVPINTQLLISYYNGQLMSMDINSGELNNIYDFKCNIRQISIYGDKAALITADAIFLMKNNKIEKLDSIECKGKLNTVYLSKILAVGDEKGYIYIYDNNKFVDIEVTDCPINQITILSNKIWCVSDQGNLYHFKYKNGVSETASLIKLGKISTTKLSRSLCCIITTEVGLYSGNYNGVLYKIKDKKVSKLKIGEEEITELLYHDELYCICGGIVYKITDNNKKYECSSESLLAMGLFVYNNEVYYFTDKRFYKTKVIEKKEFFDDLLNDSSD